MVPVKELLNVVVNCGIWGRLRCAAASIGYPAQIRKGAVHRRRHAAVMELLSSSKSAVGPVRTGVSAGLRNAQGAALATLDPIAKHRWRLLAVRFLDRFSRKRRAHSGSIR